MKLGPKEIKEINQYLITGRNKQREFVTDDDTRVGFAKGTQQSRTTAGTFDKVYNMAEIRKLGKELNVSEVIDGVKLDPDKFRSNVTKAKARTDFYKNQFKSLSPKKQKEFKKDFMKQIAKHQDGGFYISAANRVPNAKLVKKYFPKANDANKIVTSINGILLNEFKNKGNVIKTSPKANANAIRMEDMRKITNPTFETAEGVQGTKGASLQHVASKNRLVTLNNLAYLEKKLNSSMSQNDKRIKIIEKEVDKLIKNKPKNYVERVNALNTEGMALASGYIKKDGKIVKGPTAGYSEFRIKDPLNEKLSYFGKDDLKTILPDKDSVLIQQDADLIDKPVKDMSPKELKRATEIAKKKQIDFRKTMSDGPTLGMNLGLFRGLGEAVKAVPTPLGTAALTAGVGVDPKSSIDRASIAAEAAFAPQLVQQSAKMGAAQRFFNLGLPAKTALRLARLASPIGIAALGAEGLYQAGKFTKKRMGELKAMSPEQRKELRSEGARQAFDPFMAAGGGIAKEAGDSSGRPPESGPQPQGLLSLKNRVRNY